MPNSPDLGPRLESYVAELVTSGRFESRTDVLREGIRLVEEREKRLADLDAAIDRGLADADAGRVTPVEKVARRLADKYQALAKNT